MYALLMVCWPISFMLMPLGNIFARMADGGLMTWIGIAIILTPIRIGVLNFPCDAILTICHVIPMWSDSDYVPIE